MDDILASIRRIISDDDALPLSRRARAAVRSRETAPAAEPPVPPPSPAQQPATQAAPAPVDAFFGLGHRLGHHFGRESDAGSVGSQSKPNVVAPASSAPAAEAPTAAAPPPPAAPVSVAPRTSALKLRDFTLKNFIARPIAAREAPAAETNAAPQDGAASLPAGELRPSLAEAERPAAPPPSSVVSLPSRNGQAGETRLKIAPLTFRAPVFSPPPAPPPLESAPLVEPALGLAPVPEPVTEKPAEPSLPALLSPASDAKIGASFEALAESLFAREPDLFERVTREMLRPMLKAWLDDNLPGVVERLVRAEIERVARGRG